MLRTSGDEVLLILFFFGIGTMVDFLKHEGTTDRERLNMSVKTPASWNVHAQSTRLGMPSDVQHSHIGFIPVSRFCFGGSCLQLMYNSESRNAILVEW